MDTSGWRSGPVQSLPWSSPAGWHCFWDAGPALEALKLGDFAHSQALDFLSTGLIVLPVLALIPQWPPRPNHGSSPSIRQFLRYILGIVAGTALSLVIGANLVLITVLVHIAIHGVRQVQPLRQLGVQFDASAFDPDATRLFNWGAVAAVILWLAAVACLWRFARSTPPRTHRLDGDAWRWRLLMAVTMAALACLVVAGGWLFVTRISPILGRYIWLEKPPLLWWLASLFLATAASWMTAMLLRPPGFRGHEYHPCDAAVRSVSARPAAGALLPAVWWVCNLIDTIHVTLGSLMREMPGLLFGDVSSLLMLAYSLSWVQFAWRRWKGYDASRLELRACFAVARGSRLAGQCCGDRRGRTGSGLDQLRPLDVAHLVRAHLGRASVGREQPCKEKHP